MKKMKLLLLFVFVMPLFFNGIAVQAGQGLQNDEKVTVYYFHNKRRCPTCMAIEKETKMVLQEEAFASAVEKGDIIFKSVNAEDASNKKLVKQLGVAGSALIVTKGETKTDLTSKGFMYALKQPEKLREALRETLNK